MSRFTAPLANTSNETVVLNRVPLVDVRLEPGKPLIDNTSSSNFDKEIPLHQVFTRSALRSVLALIAVVASHVSGIVSGEEIKLSALDLTGMTLGWGSPGINTSVGGQAMSIGGKSFVYGVGTHAASTVALDLKGASKRFTAQVGVDDEVGDKGSVEFKVLGDGKPMWSSGILRGKNEPKAVDLDLTGIKTLTLIVEDAKDGDSGDHADWADAVISYQGKAPSPAAQSIPHIFSDNMVLQRDKPVPVWGWAKPGELVKVAFSGQVKKATADDKGNWMVRLDPMPANKTGQELAIGLSAETVIFKNVLVGEVWICSGQSNMEFGLGNSVNGQAEVKTANPLIRFIQIPKVCYASPRNDVKAAWQVSTPQTVGACTAVGYFFARELVRELDVPVGLIHSNWSGTSIEPWLCREGLAAVPELKNLSNLANDLAPDSESGQKRLQQYQARMKAWLPEAEKARAQKQPLPPIPIAPQGIGGNSGQLTHIFNGLVYPLIPYAIRGTIWYQGESNGQEGDSYFHKMRALIGGWRQLWKQGDFPFYWVQLANFQTSNPDKPEMDDGIKWPHLREAQLKSLSIPNTGMAVIIDIGEGPEIHPRNKQDVGKRLAAWALARDYGKKIECSGPLYQGFKVEGNKIRVKFDHSGSRLILGEKLGLEAVKEVPGSKLKWISIAGEDKKFYWADAVLDGNTLLISSDKVAHPVAVRYAFAMNPMGANLYNKEGFPASPFRTDNW